MRSWGKSANNLRVFCRQVLDSHPHIQVASRRAVYQQVHNSRSFLISPIGYTIVFPPVNLVNLPPLFRYFSPLSTIPITITTNVKKNERQ